MSKFKEKQKKISGKNSEIEDIRSEKQESQLDEDFENDNEITSLQKMANESKDVEELEKTEENANKEGREKAENDSKKKKKVMNLKSQKKKLKNNKKIIYMRDKIHFYLNDTKIKQQQEQIFLFIQSSF